MYGLKKRNKSIAWRQEDGLSSISCDILEHVAGACASLQDGGPQSELCVSATVQVLRIEAYATSYMYTQLSIQ